MDTNKCEISNLENLLPFDSKTIDELKKLWKNELWKLQNKLIEKCWYNNSNYTDENLRLLQAMFELRWVTRQVASDQIMLYKKYWIITYVTDDWKIWMYNPENANIIRKVINENPLLSQWIKDYLIDYAKKNKINNKEIEI